MSERGSRWQASTLTFGPVGRLLVTAVLLAVAAWLLLFGGIFGLVGLVVWCGWVLPRALRDTWRPAALPATDLTWLRDESRRAVRDPSRPHPVFGDEERPPPRW